MSGAHAESKIATILTRVVILVIFLGAASLSPEMRTALLPAQFSPTQESDLYPVVHVVDGDTLDVRKNGATERVRLLGINTPESVGDRPAECYGKEASLRAKELLSGTRVRLEFDASQSLTDKYGRLLAYVYTEDGQMINRKLVNEGYAYEYTYLKPYLYQKDFREAQMFAKNTQTGLWSPTTCNGLRTRTSS